MRKGPVVICVWASWRLKAHQYSQPKFYSSITHTKNDGKEIVLFHFIQRMKGFLFIGSFFGHLVYLALQYLLFYANSFFYTKLKSLLEQNNFLLIAFDYNINLLMMVYSARLGHGRGK